MQTYVRYFVTQQLGTAYGRVEFDDTTGGHALIVIPSMPPVYRKFSFRLADVAKALPDKSQWSEMILRVAISQAHWHYTTPSAEDFFDPTVPLSFTTPPWEGLLVELDDTEDNFRRPNAPPAASAALYARAH
jgi:hypothetical protein